MYHLREIQRQAALYHDPSSGTCLQCAEHRQGSMKGRPSIAAGIPDTPDRSKTTVKFHLIVTSCGFPPRNTREEPEH